GALVDASILADTPSTREKIFEFRHRLPQRINEFLRSTGQLKAATDIAVPHAAFRQMYDFYRETAQNSKLAYVILAISASPICILIFFLKTIKKLFARGNV
ncbi:MAG: hypothetical protein PHV55_06620, partial [Candidatus Omnitrophica bacterium]|nr:hypothetical protein [Candidatus Omnitrophota bacterium]